MTVKQFYSVDNLKSYCRLFFCIFAMLSMNMGIKAQEVPVAVSAEEVYNFMDELASEKIIFLNSAVKPYTRSDIQTWLLTADTSRQKLNKRQLGMLDMLLVEFTGGNPSKPAKEGSVWKILPPEFRYLKKNGNMIIRPLYSFRYSVYDGMPFYYSGGGAEAIFGKAWVSAYASLTDNFLNRNILVEPGYLMPGQGGNYKYNEGGRKGGDYSEMRGGVVLNWKWGRIGFVKDNVSWGENIYGGLILSGNNPSTPMITLHVQPFKWFSLDYIHAWLVSEVIDSASSYFSQPGIFRGIYQPKYIAANMFTFTPIPGLNISLGNSIVYSDVPVQAVFLIPVLFYKSVDHTINHGIDNQNSQMFLNISSRNIRHLHLFGSVFIDEFSIPRIRDKNRYNFFGYKAGFALYNWPLQNLSLDAECTVIYPMVYKHRVPSLTYTSNRYNLGYYMGDNSLDINAGLRYSPKPYLINTLHYCYAVHGNDYPYQPGPDLDRHTLLKNIVWSRHLLSLRTVYMPVAGIQVFIEGLYSNTRGYEADGLNPQDYLKLYTPVCLQGEHFYCNFGFKIGL